MGSLMSHLHDCIIGRRVSTEAFEAALRFIRAVGQAADAHKNEVVLAGDLPGLSAVVALLNDVSTGRRPRHEGSEQARRSHRLHARVGRPSMRRSSGQGTPASGVL